MKTLPMINRECGDCHYCCISPHIPVLGKPAGQPCVHLNMAKGCTQYAIRPMACREFKCVWLESPVLGNDLRPDRCHVMFEAYYEERMVIATSTQPGAWQRGEPYKLIMRMLFDGYPVWIVEGVDRHLLLPQGMTKAQAEQRTIGAWRRKTCQPQATQLT